MITFIIAANLVNAPVDTTSVTISHIDRTATTLGSRGKRISETWQVKVNGTTATIDFAPYHTRFANTPALHGNGDQVELNLSANEKTTLTAGGTLHLTISAVKN